MKKKIFKSLRFMLFLSIAGILLYFAFRGIDFNELRNSFSHANYWFIGVYLLFGFLSLLTRAYRWIIMIEPLNYKASFMNSFYALNTGYLANFAFPRLGELTRCVSLSRAEKIPVDKLFGTVILERIIDLMMVVILLFLLVIFRAEFFGKWLGENILDPLIAKLNESIGGAWILLVALIGIPVICIIIYYIFREKLSRIGIIQKIKSFIKGIFDGLKTIYQLKRRWAFILHTLLIWFCYWAMTYGALFALPETAVLKPIDGLFVLIVGSFGFILPAQGGIGAYHLIATLALTIYKIPREVGLTYATISHGSQMIMLIVLGIFSFMMLFAVQRRNKKEEEQITEEGKTEQLETEPVKP